MNLRNCLFVGGGPLSGWHPVRDDLLSYVAAVPNPIAISAFVPIDGPFDPFARSQRVTYHRRRYASRAMSGGTLELVTIDGWLMPRRMTDEVTYVGADVFVLGDYEPTMTTITEESFWRTPGVRIIGPWSGCDAR